MATDLFGKPIGGYPEFKLSLQQKRQATLLYHWMSLEYIKGLKDLIDALIKGADVTLDLAQRQGRDELIANKRWGVRDTASNWSTYAFPALQDFRKSTIWHIDAIANEDYGKTGAYQCGRMLSEYSSMWMTPEEEERFNEQFEVVYQYAHFIDFAAGAGGRRPADDALMTTFWSEHRHLFHRLPKFRVRTDIEAVSRKKPPRTGVYVAQDDQYATLQFAWRGNDDGILGEAVTFNEIGLRLLATVGRDALWIDDTKLIPFALDEMVRNPGMDTGLSTLERVRQTPSLARNAMANVAFTRRPCKWYFVEKLEGEFDDEPDTASPPANTALAVRCEANRPCPREGWWFTPAKPGSRRHFQQGEVMPAFKTDYGLTIWQWDERQSN